MPRVGDRDGVSLRKMSDTFAGDGVEFFVFGSGKPENGAGDFWELREEVGLVS